MSLVPEVSWAQRSSADEPAKNIIYLTINAPDIAAKDLKLDLQPKLISFSGFSSSKNTQYAVDLKLDREIDPEESKTHHTSRGIDLVLRKKEAQAEFWPRLLEGKKMHFLKTDFDKWVDEDEQDEVADEDPYAAMGGMEGMQGGMPGMGGMGGMGGADGGFGGIDFSKLGEMGGAGMPGLEGLGGMGGMNFGGAAGDEEGDEEEGEEEGEGVPSLEGEDAAAAAKAGKPKIEEVA